MFHDVKILIAESERSIERVLTDCLKALSFTVLSAGSVSACMECIQSASPDILILDEDLVNGTSQIILDYWIARRQGPILVFVPPEPVGQGRHNHPLLGKGVWNVLRLDKSASDPTEMTDMQALNTTILRYTQIVEVLRGCRLQQETIDRFKKVHRALWASTITLAISLVAYAGPDVLPKVFGLIFGGG